MRQYFDLSNYLKGQGIESLRAQRSNLCLQKRLLRRLWLLAMTPLLTLFRQSLSSLGSLLLVVAPVVAQNSLPDIQPAPLVRLTGVLKTVADPPVSAFPVLRVWIRDGPQVFRVARVESVIPAYPAEERLRAVSTLGLRLLAEPPVLAALQSPEFHDRLIVIEGWLRPKAGVLRVRSVEKVKPDRELR
jgi:hypothetical protein